MLCDDTATGVDEVVVGDLTAGPQSPQYCLQYMFNIALLQTSGISAQSFLCGISRSHSAAEVNSNVEIYQK